MVRKLPLSFYRCFPSNVITDMLNLFSVILLANSKVQPKVEKDSCAITCMALFSTSSDPQGK